jgi:hypothetical protein
MRQVGDRSRWSCHRRLFLFIFTSNDVEIEASRTGMTIYGRRQCVMSLQCLVSHCHPDIQVGACYIPYRDALKLFISYNTILKCK